MTRTRKELNYFKIEGADGGSQDWFRDPMMNLGGCAAATACDSSLFLAFHYGMTGLYPFDPDHLTKEDYIRFASIMEALDFARTMGFCGKELDKVVRDAISCSKRIKTELRISEKPLSVSYVGIQKLKELTGIEDRTILVIGSGRTAVLALKYLYEYSAGHVIVCSRTLSKAKGLRNEYPEMEVVEYEKRYEAMKRCDIVISATSSPHLVIRRDDLTCVRPMTFLDLAAPRDIDTGIAELPEMKLINLDTLREIVEENRKERERLVEAGQVITEQCLNDTMDWFLTSRMLEERCQVPTLGVIPYLYLNLEDEDSLTTRFNKKDEDLIDLAVIRFPRISNFTDFDVFERIEGVSLRYVDSAAELKNPDMEKNRVTIQTPKGTLFEAVIEGTGRGGDTVTRAVRKDGGDDPDITTGALIYAEVSILEEGGETPRVVIDGGQGVGRVTKPGLDQPVGNAAINHGQRGLDDCRGYESA